MCTCCSRPTVNMHRTPSADGTSRPIPRTRCSPARSAPASSEGAVRRRRRHRQALRGQRRRDRPHVRRQHRVPERTCASSTSRPFEAIVRDAGTVGDHVRLQQRQRHHDERAHRAPRATCSATSGASTASWSPTGWARARRSAPSCGGLDVAMPGPANVYGELLVKAVQYGEVDESVVDDAVRHVLLLAARVGLLEGAPARSPSSPPRSTAARSPARSPAGRSCSSATPRSTAFRAIGLPIAPAESTVALIGLAARDARVLGGGSRHGVPRARRLPARRADRPRCPRTR